jgi:hypothetical protein
VVAVVQEGLHSLLEEAVEEETLHLLLEEVVVAVEVERN